LDFCRLYVAAVTKFLARAVLTAFIVGTIPAMIDAPAAIAQMSANKPHGILDDCVPVGVTTRPDGSVWAVENCHGVEVDHIMQRK
jgi:hypothetical protein